MKIHTTTNNFSRGKMDHDMNGRFELPIYTSGVDVMQNFFGNFKGNAIFRSGFEKMLKHEDCRMLEFKFNKEQSYILVFTDLELKFLSYDVSGNFGWVQSGGGDLAIVTPYSLAESKELTRRSVAQNADVMYITHPSHPPQKLTRVSATSFTIATFVRTADPFTGAGDYPSIAEFYKGALYYGATDNEVTTIWRSKFGSYDDMTIGSADDDGLKFAISDLTEQLEWLASGNNSLIGGSAQALVAINGGSTDAPITPSTVSAFVTNTDGASDAQPVRKDNLLFYVNAHERNLNYFSYDILTESFTSQDANAVSYDITAGKIGTLAYKKDRNDLIFMLRDGDLLSMNFNQAEKIVGWHEHTAPGSTFEDMMTMNDNDGNVQLFTLMKHGTDYYICRLDEENEFLLFNEFYTGDYEADREAFIRYFGEALKTLIYSDISEVVKNEYTSTITYTGTTGVGDTGTIVSSAADFASGDVGHRIVLKTATGLEHGYYKITGYTNTTTVSVEVLATPTDTVYASWYKTFATITGLTDWVGETMVVVGDGGYLDDFVVDGSGEVELGREISVAVIGFGYEGLIKTFNLGFTFKGINTQVTPKTLSRVYARFVASAGGEVGTSQYRMEAIQDLSLEGYYDSPPLPMDGDKDVTYTDESAKEKFVYIRQSKPLPLRLTSLVLEMEYGTDL